MAKPSESQVVPVEIIERRIYLIRGQKVILDSDIAALYEVPTKRLNEAVQRNADRFPTDFMFQLTDQEVIGLRSQFATSNLEIDPANSSQIAMSSEKTVDRGTSALRSQFATLKTGRGTHRKYLPYAFTEHGVAMLSAVLRSERAVLMSIAIVRAFVKIRELLASNKELANRVEKLEGGLKNHGRAISLIVKEIDDLKSLPEPKNKRIM